MRYFFSDKIAEIFYNSLIFIYISALWGVAITLRKNVVLATDFTISPLFRKMACKYNRWVVHTGFFVLELFH